MPELQNFTNIKVHRFKDKAQYQKALEAGHIKPGEWVAIDGDEFVVDKVLTPGSKNPVSSAAVYDAVEEATVEMTNSEIEDLFKMVFKE